MKKIFTLVILLSMGITQTQIYAQCFNCETNTKAFTIGSYNTATGNNSFAGGSESSATGSNSFAFGNISFATQSGSIAIGSNALSNALNSYVFGQNLSSQGENSITIGLGSSSSQLLENNKNNSIMFGVTQNPTLTILKPKNADVGYLGIGTDDPKEMVHLHGKLLIERTANTPSSLQFKHHTTNTKDIINPPSLNTYYWDIYSDVQGLKFNTISSPNTNPPKPDQRLVITSTGSVGIGAGNPLTNFQIGALWTFQTGTNNNIGINTYNNKTNDLRIQSGAASRLSFNDSGDILLQTTPSGDAGSTIRWNTVTVASNGDVGIGTTDAPAAKLEVAGSFKAQDANLTGALKAASATIATINGNTYVNGNFGIGINPTTNKLEVKGTIRAEEVKVCVSQGCDFVFEEDYELMSLNDLNNFIKTNKHLPGVAPAAEMEAEGIKLSEMNTTLLQKVEELTLYILDLQKQIDELKNSKP